MILFELFLGFLQVGTFTIGGGYAAVPLIRDVVLGHGWLTEESLTAMIAVSESTPGPIMVNMATYIGSSQAGLPGAAVATAAVVLPSFAVIMVIAALMHSAVKNPWVQAVLGGLKACVVGIILATGGCMTAARCFPAGQTDWRAVGITAVLAAILFGGPRVLKRKLSPITLILVSACVGILVYGI